MIYVDDTYMATAVGNPVPRVNRITPWPIRILVPIAVIVAIAGVVHGGSVWAVPIPLALGVVWIGAAEWCGLVVTDMGIETRMTRRQNRFRHGWSDVGSFEFVDNGKQVATAMRLGDGSRTLLPSTRTWSWDKRAVQRQ